MEVHIAFKYGSQISMKSPLPFFPLRLLFHPLPLRSSHDPLHIPLHTLLVQSIQLKAILGRRTRRPGSRNPFHGVEGVDKHPV